MSPKLLWNVGLTVALHVLYPGVCSAQRGKPDMPTVAERVAAAVATREPSWEVVEPFSSARGSVRPSSSGRWRTGGGLVSIDLVVFDSTSEAAEALTLQRTGRAMSVPEEPLPGYGAGGYRTATEISFHAFNVLVRVSASRPPVPLRAAELTRAEIPREVLVNECVDELSPDRRPAPRHPSERLHRAAERGCRPDVASALLAGADPNALFDRVSSLFAAAQHLHVDAVRALLDAGAAPEAADPDSGVTAMWAVLHGPSRCCTKSRPRSRAVADRLIIIDALLEKGANINTRRADGRTVLLDATRDGFWNDRKFIEALLARGADARVRDHSGDTALTLLINHTPPSVLASDPRIPLLIAAGVDVNATNQAGKTALKLIREQSYVGVDLSSVTRALIAAGAR